MKNKTIKDFYHEYKADTTPYKMCNKTFIKLYGNNFVKYAQNNGYAWEPIKNLICSFGFKYIETR